MCHRHTPWAASKWFAQDHDSRRPLRPTNNDHIRITDDEFPLDAFDRQLLAEADPAHGPDCSQSTSGLVHINQHTYVPWSASNDLKSEERPSYCIYSPSNDKDDLQRTWPIGSIGSSSEYHVSSPVISSLQSKQARNIRANAGHQISDQALSQSQALQKEPGNAVPAFERRFGPNISKPPVVQGIQLIPTSRLPDNMRSLYKFPIFNAIQSKCFERAYQGDDNIVLSAPTGSGKTVVLELAIFRLLVSQHNEEFKVVYQAPTKSLCGERYRDWTAKFKTLGLQCAELTGDSEFVNLRNVQRAHVIITTPEKWDSATRNWKDNAKLMRMIKLFLVDEVHILKESRGATLEAVVSRMKSVDAGVRFVALSATVPNSADIASWLGLNPGEPNRPAIREVFGESFRPVTLEKHVLGFQSPPNDFILDTILTKEIPSIIARYSKRKPVMIFCATRKIAATQATKLANLWKSTAFRDRLWNGPSQHLRAIDDNLKECINTGVAFHHSGLDQSDRQAVENGFMQGDISIICCTSTLAVGINLPCYLVVLKGTAAYSDDGLQEYTSLEVMQMLGRAGRPQFETSACAVIMTNKTNTDRYERMISGNETVESCLHQNLIEHLSAEIGIGTIHDMPSAKRWLRSTFFSVRLRQNPRHYQLRENCDVLDEDLLLEKLCEKDVNLLVEAKLVDLTRAGFRGSEFGDIMARYYVKYETMKKFLAMPKQAKMSEILTIMTQASEFNELRWRAGERTFYKQVNKTPDIRFPVKVDVALAGHKACLIAQMNLGGVVLDKEAAKKHFSQFKLDSRIVLNHCNRLIRCTIDSQVVLKDAVSVRNALELSRSLAAGVWDNTPLQLKQINGIGDITARKLASAGIKNFDALLSTEPHEIDLALGKSQPYGSNLLKKASMFPSLRVSIHEVGRKIKADKGVELRVRCEVGFLNASPPLYFNSKSVFVVFLCETSNGQLVDFRRFGARKLSGGDQILLNILIDEPTTYLHCHVMCDEIAGSHRFAELKLNIPAAHFPQKVQHKALTSNPTEEYPTTRNALNDEFYDDTLADIDFLAVEADLTGHTTTGHTTTVDDTHGQIDKGTKRKRDSKASTEEVSTHWRKPEQLENGRWTCQHTCNDEGKECHHVCCKQGVKKPRKRPTATRQVANKIQPGDSAAADKGASKDAKKHGSQTTVSVLQMASISASAMKLKQLGHQSAVSRSSTKPGRIFELPSSSSESGEQEMDHYDPIECDWHIPAKVDLSDSVDPRPGQPAPATRDVPQTSPMKLFCSTASQGAVVTEPAHHNSGPTRPDMSLCSDVFDGLSDLSDIDLSTYDDIEMLESKKELEGKTADTVHVHEHLAARDDRHEVDTESRTRQQMQRSSDEEQRRKWQDLDPSLYEQFGHCIELI